MTCRRARPLAAALALAVLPGIARANPPAVLDPRGPAARTLANLGGPVLWLFLVISAVMWLLVLWVALRRRGSLESHERAEVGGGQPWILIGGFGIPAVILAVLYVLNLQGMNAFPIMPAHRAPVQIAVTGHQWWWEVEYASGALDQNVTTANEIHIPVGVPVDVSLQTADVIHSFWVPQLHGKVDLIPGQMNHIRIEADRPGRYRGQCAEYCGAQHAHMMLWITADPPARFRAWLANEGASAAAPGDSLGQRGQAIFVSNACAMCHTVRGTPAGGKVGPDLTHIGSRPTIAAGSYPNDQAHLAAWIVHAQSLKPGAQMPDLALFTGPQLQALVRYLQQLR